MAESKGEGHGLMPFPLKYAPAGQHSSDLEFLFSILVFAVIDSSRVSFYDYKNVSTLPFTSSAEISNGRCVMNPCPEPFKCEEKVSERRFDCVRGNLKVPTWVRFYSFKTNSDPKC